MLTSCVVDIVLENIVHEARTRLEGEQGNQEEAVSKPYKYFTLSNSLTENEGETSNFYVFQKVFQGDFQFDVLFRSQSSDDPITSKSFEKECAFEKILILALRFR
jgi:mannosyl-oligosaccharide glucosidase